MRIYPAIDIIGGMCVRLVKGDYSQKTTFAENPVDVAKKWESLGAEFIHVVDLDGAKSGELHNFELIKKIAESVNVPIQVGGGIRSLDDIDKLLEAGISRVIIGTSALENPNMVKRAVEKYGDKIAVGIDAKNGKAAVKGWVEVSDESAIDLAIKMRKIGVKHIVYTDIDTDGMLKGPNIDAMRKMVEESKIDVIASGGVSTVEDVEKLVETGVEGAIIGRALYSEVLDLPSAIRAAKDMEYSVEDFISELKFDGYGLIPAIAQDAVSGEVLMCAYMNVESLKLTIETGNATYYSRSRKAIWEKGATSGHYQKVREILVDCDGDALVLKIEQMGAACHTNNYSCFYRSFKDGKLKKIKTGNNIGQGVIYDVYDVICDRKENPKEGSYTNYLLNKGIDKILKKVGEEATEVVIAAKNSDNAETKYEIADLLYHISVMLVNQGITWDEVFDELQKRR